MPGPCNSKRKKKQHSRREKKITSPQPSLDDLFITQPSDSGPHPIYELLQPLPDHDLDETCPDDSAFQSPPYDAPHDYNDQILLGTPNIYDPGNGPRVRDTRAFLSSFFAQPAALDDPLCAEFAQEEILQMLCTVLPEEVAIILWYNKSRATGRICPSCRRLYNLGDVLPDLIHDPSKVAPEPRSPYLAREQEISGLCSPLCFIMASFSHPGAIKTTWGRIAEDMDEYTWELLNGPGTGTGDQGLCMLMKMARLPDLGLGQLCLPDIDFESER